MTTEPTPTGLHLTHELDRSLRIGYQGRDLARYVYRPWDRQLESPRPYFHPLRTLGGDLVSLYRPHDHVWHKGIALSLPNVGSQNFWGGTTYNRGHGYRQLDNDGSMTHRGFVTMSATDQRIRVVHDLDWITQAGQTWFDERRGFEITVDAGRPGVWCLAFSTRFTNVSDAEIVIGSPTTQGRDNAGYGGLFWRGPRSFTGGTVYAPGKSGGDELMGIRSDWMGFTGQHDDTGRRSTLVFVDGPNNPGHPTQWFVRSNPFAAVCPAPFFDTEIPVAPGNTVCLDHAVLIADGETGLDDAEALAKSGMASLITLDRGPS